MLRSRAPSQRNPWLIALPCLLAACSHAPAPQAPEAVATANAPPPAVDSVTAERMRFANEAMALVKGRETAPVESVFKNLKVLRGFPAARLIPIMNIGYGRSLGVSCTHCHVAGDWASDEKKPKEITRDMVRLSATIATSLSNIEGLKGRQPIVNCTTCHRGALKPALNLP